MLEARDVTFGYGKRTLYEGFNLSIAPGERVAQLCIAPVWQAAFVPAATLNETERGEGGFGSTGK